MDSSFARVDGAAGPPELRFVRGCSLCVVWFRPAQLALANYMGEKKVRPVFVQFGAAPAAGTEG